MPNIVNYLFRLYCNNCNDFTIHDKIKNNDEVEYICTCKSIHVPVDLSTIDPIKIEEQQKRYSQQAGDFFKESVYFNPSNAFDDFFKPVEGPQTKIIEDDAGLIEVQNIAMQKRREERRKQQEEVLQYKQVNRNDTCLCGSGKKYKKCCLLKHNKY